MSEAPSHGTPGVCYDRWNKASNGYLKLADEFLKREKALQKRQRRRKTMANQKKGWEPGSARCWARRPRRKNSSDGATVLPISKVEPRQDQPRSNSTRTRCRSWRIP
jgi:hypothetical protein